MLPDSLAHVWGKDESVALVLRRKGYAKTPFACDDGALAENSAIKAQRICV